MIIPRQPSIRQLRFLPALLIAASIAALTFRMTIGVNFTDESYYAAFVDGWLKTGIAGSHDLMAHQTAALLVSPLVLVYSWINGGVDGLMLFLRIVYLALATMGSLCLYRAVALHRGRFAATVTALFALWFIPFGLPAPSYNTIGMWSVLAALALFTVQFARSPAALPTTLPGSMWLSAAWWVVGVIAYPTMAVSGVMLVLIALGVLRDPAERRLILRYAATCAVLGMVAIGVVCAVLQPAHVLQMLRFTNSLNDVSGGMSRKFHVASAIFGASPRFAHACSAALVVAVIGFLARPATWIKGVADAAVALLIIVVVTTPQPELFAYSHNIVLLLALACSGGALRRCAERAAPSSDRVFGVVFAVGLCSGAVTMVTAYNGVFNFPIGGFAAACMGVALWFPRAPLDGDDAHDVNNGLHGSLAATAGAGAALLAAVTMCWTAFALYYGEPGLTYDSSVPMPPGVYAGLRTDAGKAEYARQMTQTLKAVAGCGDTISVLRGDAGIYLMTPMKPETVSTWGATPGAGPLAAETIDGFFTAHPAAVVVVDESATKWKPALSEAAKKLVANYVFVTKVSVGPYRTSIYRQSTCRGG